MPLSSFEIQLKKLGLTDKEAAVYLALLAGPSSVLTVSRKSKVARATTYLILERLIEMGLVSVYKKGESQQFVAEKPEHLSHLINRRREDLDQAEILLKDLVPMLSAMTWAEDSRPTVRYYYGKEGLRTLRSEMLKVSKRGDVWHNFSPFDHLYEVFGEREYLYDKQRLGMGIKSRTIFTTQSETIKQAALFIKDKKRIQRKFISPKKYRSGTGITIYNDRVAFGTMDKQLGGFIVESSSVATMMRDIFNLVWENLE